MRWPWHKPETISAKQAAALAKIEPADLLAEIAARRLQPVPTRGPFGSVRFNRADIETWAHSARGRFVRRRGRFKRRIKR